MATLLLCLLTLAPLSNLLQGPWPLHDSYAAPTTSPLRQLELKPIDPQRGELPLEIDPQLALELEQELYSDSHRRQLLDHFASARLPWRELLILFAVAFFFILISFAGTSPGIAGEAPFRRYRQEKRRQWVVRRLQKALERQKIRREEYHLLHELLQSQLIVYCPQLPRHCTVEEAHSLLAGEESDQVKPLLELLSRLEKVRFAQKLAPKPELVLQGLALIEDDPLGRNQGSEGNTYSST